MSTRKKEAALFHPKMFQLARMGVSDTSRRLEADGACFACVTSDGPATLRVRFQNGSWHINGWGPGASKLLAVAPRVCGERDTLDHFDASAHPRLRRLWAQNRGLRLIQAPSLFGCLLSVVLQQRVSWRDATRSNRLMYDALGKPAPGPCELVLPPSPAQLRALPTYAFHAFGVERKRAETIKRIARIGHDLEHLRDAPVKEIETSLSAIPGVGPWTIQMFLGLGLGHPDALPLGDYGLPHAISWFFEGKPRSNDDEMTRTLAPFRPHRFRVIRLLWATKYGAAPRYGPKRPLRPISNPFR